MLDFNSLNDVKDMINKHPFPADGIFQDNGNFYSVLITFIPGPSFRGMLPKTEEVERFIQSHNWRKA